MVVNHSLMEEHRDIYLGYFYSSCPNPISYPVHELQGYRKSVFTDTRNFSDPFTLRAQENNNVPHIKLLSKIVRIARLNKHRPFIHQLQPVRLRLSSRHRSIVLTRNDVDQFCGEPTQPRRVTHRHHRFSDYFALLGRNDGSRRDGVRWVDEEGDEDLADSGLSRVFETEGLGLVLVDVWEGDTTTLDCLDASKLL